MCFFLSLYLSVFQILCLLTFSLFPPDPHVSLPSQLSLFSCSQPASLLSAPLHVRPLVGSPSVGRFSISPPPSQGVYGFMMHGNLSANTFICSFFIFLSLSLSLALSFFSFLVAQQGSELPDDAYRIFTFDFPHAEQSGAYGQKKKAETEQNCAMRCRTGKRAKRSRT